MDIGLVIFDCDGVLIDSEVLAVATLIEALQPLGVRIDEAFVHRHFLGRGFPVIREVLAERFGVLLPDGFEAVYRGRLSEVFAAGLRPVPGVIETVRALRVPYCLATSSAPERLAVSLRIAGLAPLFEGCCFTASQVARGKPAPDLFLLAAAGMGVAPARCLVIEDTLPGLRAGLAAGMQVWRFIGGSHFRGAVPDEPADCRPHRRFACFTEFFDLAPGLRRARCGALP